MKYLSKILFFTLIVSFSSYAQNAKSGENIKENPEIGPIFFPCPPPPGGGNPAGCGGCEMKAFIIDWGVSFPNGQNSFNNTIFAGYAINKGLISKHIGLKFSQETQKIRTSTFDYQKLSLPVRYYWNPTKNISLGGGVQAEMLLNAKENGKAIQLQTDLMKKFGFGTTVGFEVGAKNRGPRLALHYTQHFGAGSTRAKSYGTIDLTLRVQICKKPQ